MAKKKRLGISVFVVILTLLMLGVIIFTALVNFKFSSSAKSGTLFGKHIYIMETDDMSPEIDKGSAVISDNSDTQVLTEGSVILFKQSKNFENIMRIVGTVHNTDSTIYKVAYDKSPDNVIEISKDDVIAKCDQESQNFGKIISFLKSTLGLVVGLLLPFVILLMIIIAKIISVRKYSEDGAEESYEYDDEDENENEDEEKDSLLSKKINPLFIPDGNINQDAEFEKKKSSIAKNFAKKPGAVRSRERIPSEKRAENAVEKFKAAVDEKPSAPVTRKPTLAPEGDNSVKSEKMAAIKNALSSGAAETKAKNGTVESKTMSIKIPAENPFTPSSSEPKASSYKSVSKKPAASPTQHKKEENIKSIDDLIRMLEEEKKKL